MSITVIDVIRSLYIEPTPELSWAVGARVRDIYELRYGTLPPKELRQKTNEGGTHCFAVYPDNMWNEIEDVIRLFNTEKSRQMDMFENQQAFI